MKYGWCKAKLLHYYELDCIPNIIWTSLLVNRDTRSGITSKELTHQWYPLAMQEETICWNRGRYNPFQPSPPLSTEPGISSGFSIPKAVSGKTCKQFTNLAVRRNSFRNLLPPPTWPISDHQYSISFIRVRMIWVKWQLSGVIQDTTQQKYVCTWWNIILADTRHTGDDVQVVAIAFDIGLKSLDGRRWHCIVHTETRTE